MAASCPAPLGQPLSSLRPQPSLHLSLGMDSGLGLEGLREMCLLCSWEEGKTSPSSLALVHPHSGTTLPLGRPRQTAVQKRHLAVQFPGPKGEEEREGGEGRPGVTAEGSLAGSVLRSRRGAEFLQC